MRKYIIAGILCLIVGVMACIAVIGIIKDKEKMPDNNTTIIIEPAEPLTEPEKGFETEDELSLQPSEESSQGYVEDEEKENKPFAPSEQEKPEQSEGKYDESESEEPESKPDESNTSKPELPEQENPDSSELPQIDLDEDELPLIPG